jgi:hypothetical protein
MTARRENLRGSSGRSQELYLDYHKSWMTEEYEYLYFSLNKAWIAIFHVSSEERAITPNTNQIITNIGKYG